MLVIQPQTPSPSERIEFHPEQIQSAKDVERQLETPQYNIYYPGAIPFENSQYYHNIKRKGSNA
jgi:hypothetical protein